MLCSEFGVLPAVGDTPASKSVEACAPVQRAMMIVVVGPCYNHLAGMVKGREPALVLAFATERPSKLSKKSFLHRLTVHLHTIIQDLCGICAAAGRSSLTKVFSIMRELDGGTSPSTGNSLLSNPLCSTYEEPSKSWRLPASGELVSSDQACRL